MGDATLAGVLAALEEIAPLRYAAGWDNVGLLVESADSASGVQRVLLTIDLTAQVWSEAAGLGAQLIVAYHPPIFGGLKRLQRRAPQQRILLEAIARGVSVYSPHTAADAAVGGVNDWLAEGLGQVASSEPIVPHVEGGERVSGVGMGRRLSLTAPRTLEQVVQELKGHLGLPHLRLAAAPGHAEGAPITSVAICPGAGGSLFEGLREVDLLVTGEMRHHDVLSRVATGTSVILTEHTNCERGWLKVLARRLSVAVPGLQAVVSARDADPLTVA